LGQLAEKNEIKISIGVQPNGSPHFGTLTSLSLSFSLVKQFKEKGKKVSVVLEAVDTAPEQNITINGKKYQKSLAYTGSINKYINEYEELLEKLSLYSGGIDFEIRMQGDLLGSSKRGGETIEKIMKERQFVSSFLAPETNLLALRAPCPNCGLTDKHGIDNVYEGNKISFLCPDHGRYFLNMGVKREMEVLEYNTPLRSLLESLVYQVLNYL